MLIPRFTVRWLLALMAICGVLAFVISLGVAGHLWALALAIAIASLAVTMVVHAATFCIAWAINEGWRFAWRRKAAASPFATHTPPPRLIEADEPD